MDMPKSRDIRAKKNSQRKPPVTWEKNFHVTGGIVLHINHRSEGPVLLYAGTIYLILEKGWQEKQKIHRINQQCRFCPPYIAKDYR